MPSLYLYLTPADVDPPALDDTRLGQANGLLGGAVPGRLSLTTETHTGDVPQREEWHDDEPAIDAVWEEVVEVSLEVETTAQTLSAFDDIHDLTVPAVGSHRVRLSATGLDAAHDDGMDEEAASPDRYLLQLWPGASEPDRIVRQTSQRAEYWHSVASP